MYARRPVYRVQKVRSPRTSRHYLGVLVCVITGFLVTLTFSNQVVLAQRNPLHAVSVPVHQWIAYKAAEIWSTPEIKENMDNYEYPINVWHLGNDPYIDNLGYPGGGGVEGASKKLLMGAGEEDKDTSGRDLSSPDITDLGARLGDHEHVPGYSGPAFFHFWNPDSPRNGAYSDGWTLVEGIEFASSYRRAECLWNSAIEIYRTDKPQAYYYLGRMAHLLADLTVPAHVHDDTHIPGDDDGFEKYVKDNLSYYQNATASEPYTMSNIYFPDEAKPYAAPLFKLFWYTAQKTQVFASDQRSGNQIYRTQTGEERNLPDLWKSEGVTIIDDPSDIEYPFGLGNDENLKIVADAMVPHALRAVAGLYQLFWSSTHPQDGPTRPKIVMDGPEQIFRAHKGVVIEWLDEDPDSNAVISLWEDNNNYGYDGLKLVDNLLEDTGGPLGSYYLSTATMPEGKEFYIYAKIKDGYNEVNSTNYTAKIIIDHPEVGYDFEVVGTSWTDQWTLSGDRDGVAEGKEDNISVEVKLRNKSAATVSNIECEISTLNTGILITDNYNDYSNLVPGENSWGEGDFNFDISAPSISSCGFSLYITYTKNGSPYQQILTITRSFPAEGEVQPRIALDHVTVKDSLDEATKNNVDGILQSGEHVGFDLFLKNIGNSDATRVEAKITNLTTDDGTVIEVYSGWSSFPDLLPGTLGQKQVSFDFQDITIPYQFSGIVRGDIVIKYGFNEVEQTIANAALFEVLPSPWIQVTPESTNFGNTQPGTDILRTATISNLGTSQLIVSGITATHSDTTWTGDPLPWEIPPGGSKQIQVTVHTESLLGFIERNLSVVSNGRIAAQEATSLHFEGTITNTLPSFQIVTGSTYDPDISGSIIVWTDPRNGNYDIYSYDLVEKVEIPVCTYAGSQGNPRISGSLVAWTDSRNDDGVYPFNSDVYARDLKSVEEIGVANSAAIEKIVGVDGDYIAYTKEDFSYNSWGQQMSGYNVYLFNARTNTTQRITNYSRPSDGASLYSVDFHSNSNDFSNGVIVWVREEHKWLSATNGWDNGCSERLEKFEIGVDSSPFLLDYRFVYGPRTGHGKIVWVGENTAGDLQMFVWERGKPLITISNPNTEFYDVLAATDFLVFKKREAGQSYYVSSDMGGGHVVTISSQQVITDTWRADGNNLVWEDGAGIRATLLGNKVGLQSFDIVVDKDNLIEGTPTEVSVVVHNLTNTVVSGDLVVRIYNGAPENGNQLGADVVLLGEIPAFGEKTAAFTNVVFPEGQVKLSAQIVSSFNDNNLDNLAQRVLEIDDSDVVGPIISDIIVAEHGGDGDNIIGDDEQISMWWSAIDDSGIEKQEILIDGTLAVIPTSNHVSFGPLSPGDHTISIIAYDADDTPESSRLNVPIRVVKSESLRILKSSGSELYNADTLDFGIVNQGASADSLTFILYNSGEQTLSIDYLALPVIFDAISPAGNNIPPGGFATLTLKPSSTLVGHVDSSLMWMNFDKPSTSVTIYLKGDIVSLKGDLNVDGNANLADAILACQVLADFSPSQLRADYATSGCDVDGDGKVGLEELIYLLSKVQGVR